MIQWIKKICFSLLAVVFVFLAAEVGLRKTNWNPKEAETFFTDLYDPEYEMKPLAKNPWSQVEEFLNQQGFRGRLLTLEKKPGVARIICMGDSTTFGVPLSKEQAFPALLENRLRERGIFVEVFNAGVPGTNLWQQRLLFERRLAKYKPDLLIMYTVPNNREDLFASRLQMEEHPFVWNFRKTLGHLQLYRYLRSKVKPPDLQVLHHQYLDCWGGMTLAPQWVASHAFEDLSRLVKGVKGHDGKVLVVGIVSRYLFTQAQKEGLVPGMEEFDHFMVRNSLGTILPEIAKEVGAFSLSVEGPFFERQTEEELFADAVHLTEAGNRLMASLLEETICIQELLPTACPSLEN